MGVDYEKLEELRRCWSVLWSMCPKEVQDRYLKWGNAMKVECPTLEDNARLWKANLDKAAEIRTLQAALHYLSNKEGE